MRKRAARAIADEAVLSSQLSVVLEQGTVGASPVSKTTESVRRIVEFQESGRFSRGQLISDRC